MSVIRLGSIAVMARWHTINNGKHYFQIAVPKALVRKFNKRLIRHPVSQVPSEAIKDCEALGKRYNSLFRAFKGDAALDTAEQRQAAMALLRNYGLEPGDGLREANIDASRQAISEGMFDLTPHLNAFYDENLAPGEVWSSPAELANKLLKGEQRIQLSELFTAYIRNHQKRSRKTFVQGQKQHWEKLVGQVGDIAFNDLTRQHAHNYVERRLNAGVKTTSIAREINAIKAVINGAIKELDLNPRNVFLDLAIPDLGADAVKRKTASKQEVKKLIDEALAIDDDIRTIFVVVTFTGARLAEIVGLTREDINLSEQSLLIRPRSERSIKTDSQRETPLHPIALAALKRRMDENDQMFVFPRYAAKGEPVKAGAASAALSKWSKGIAESVTPHSMRHTVRDLYREVECPDQIAQAIIGWKSRQDTSQRYGDGYSMAIKLKWMRQAWKWLKAERNKSKA